MNILGVFCTFFSEHFHRVRQTFEPACHHRRWRTTLSHPLPELDSFGRQTIHRRVRMTVLGAAAPRALAMVSAVTGHQVLGCALATPRPPRATAQCGAGFVRAYVPTPPPGAHSS